MLYGEINIVYIALDKRVIKNKYFPYFSKETHVEGTH